MGHDRKTDRRKRRVETTPRGWQPLVEVLEGRRLLAGLLNGYPIPTANSQPRSITAGPDGNLWFAEEFVSGKIGRITTNGVITEFTLPTPGYVPQGITAGPDGNFWFTLTRWSGGESDIDKIGRITAAGVITEFAIPTPEAWPDRITAGPDGNLWFTESNAGQLGRITTEGVITEFTLPTPGAVPRDITAGPDGNLWFTESNAGKVGRITTEGVITEFAIPTPYNGVTAAITAGPDGHLWFTESGDSIGKISRITTEGVITEFTLPTPRAAPIGITAGPDGNLWFVDYSNDRIGRITTEGAVTEFALPTPHDRPSAITVGPDHNLWFTSVDPGHIGKFDIGPFHPVFGTQTWMTLAPNPASLGQDLTVTVVVSSASAPLLPTGIVTFAIDGQTQAAVPLTSINGQATASFSISTLAPGGHSIVAAYSGSPGFQPSSSARTVNVVIPPVDPVVVPPPIDPVVVPPPIDQPIETQTQWTVVPNAARFGQDLTFTVIVTPVSSPLLPTGSVTFSIDGHTQAVVPLTLINGQPTASFSIATLGPGAHSITAAYGGGDSFQPSTSIGTVNVNAPILPTVVAVRRYGIGTQPTKLVLFFSAPLDPRTAQDVHNYRVVRPGGRRLRVDSAAYEPQAQSVVVSLHRGLSLRVPYRLTVNGAPNGGVTDIDGNLLSGAGAGRPGTDYTTIVDQRLLVRRRQFPRPSLVAGQTVKTSAHSVHKTGR